MIVVANTPVRERERERAGEDCFEYIWELPNVSIVFCWSRVRRKKIPNRKTSQSSLGSQESVKLRLEAAFWEWFCWFYSKAGFNDIRRTKLEQLCEQREGEPQSFCVLQPGILEPFFS